MRKTNKQTSKTKTKKKKHEHFCKYDKTVNSHKHRQNIQYQVFQLE